MNIYFCSCLPAGPYLLPHHQSGLLRAVRDKADSLVAEVFVSQGSPFVGKSLEVMMNSLGIAPSRVIKIRRKLNGASDKPYPDGSPDGSVKGATSSLVLFMATWLA